VWSDWYGDNCEVKGDLDGSVKDKVGGSVGRLSVYAESLKAKEILKVKWERMYDMEVVYWKITVLGAER
jgi:hypothetical protein